MLRQPSGPLTTLKQAWPTKTKMKEPKEQLAVKIRDDPISAPLDLLSPFQGQFDENLHTRALSYLLDEGKSHKFERSTLISFVEALRGKAKHGQKRDSSAAKILALLHLKGTKITVVPEYHFAIRRARKRSVARCDIWIELDNASLRRYGLIIIENKVEAVEARDQLLVYKKEARRWCNANKPAVALLIFLSKQDQKSNRNELPKNNARGMGRDHVP